MKGLPRRCVTPKKNQQGAVGLSFPSHPLWGHPQDKTRTLCAHFHLPLRYTRASPTLAARSTKTSWRSSCLSSSSRRPTVAPPGQRLCHSSSRAPVGSGRASSRRISKYSQPSSSASAVQSAAAAARGLR